MVDQLPGNNTQVGVNEIRNKINEIILNGLGGGNANISVGPNPPSIPEGHQDGDLWYNTETSELYIYLESPTAGWVVVSGGGAGAYDTGWVDTDGTTTVSSGATMTFDHGLGTNALSSVFAVYAAEDASGTNMCSQNVVLGNDGTSYPCPVNTSDPISISDYITASLCGRTDWVFQSAQRCDGNWISLATSSLNSVVAPCSNQSTSSVRYNAFRVDVPIVPADTSTSYPCPVNTSEPITIYAYITASLCGRTDWELQSAKRCDGLLVALNDSYIKSTTVAPCSSTASAAKWNLFNVTVDGETIEIPVTEYFPLTTETIEIPVTEYFPLYGPDLNTSEYYKGIQILDVTSSQVTIQLSSQGAVRFGSNGDNTMISSSWGTDFSHIRLILIAGGGGGSGSGGSSGGSSESNSAYSTSGENFCAASHNRAAVFKPSTNTWYHTDSKSSSSDLSYVDTKNDKELINICGSENNFCVAGENRAAVFKDSTNTWYYTDEMFGYNDVTMQIVGSRGNFCVSGFDRAGVFDCDTEQWYYTESSGENELGVGFWNADLHLDERIQSDALLNVESSLGYFCAAGNNAAAVFDPSTKQWYYTIPGIVSNRKMDSRGFIVAGRISAQYMTLRIAASNGNFIVGGWNGAGVFNSSTREWYYNDRNATTAYDPIGYSILFNNRRPVNIASVDNSTESTKGSANKEKKLGFIENDILYNIQNPARNDPYEY